MNTKTIYSEMMVGKLQVSVIKKAVKNLHLNVLPPYGKVRVSVPPSMNDDAIRTFVASKLPWINRQVEKFKNQEREGRREFVSGESHYFQGKRYLLHLVDSDSPAKIKIRNKKYLDLHIKKDASKAQKEKVITEWYRSELKKQIPDLLEKWQKIMGVKVNDWRIKQMKTKWGTCNSEAKRIWINLELIKKPLPCLEYIIVHECCHLLERSHDERFVAHMNKFMPQWRTHKDELNKFILTYEEWGGMIF